MSDLPPSAEFDTEMSLERRGECSRRLTRDNSRVHTLLAQTLTFIISPLAVLDAGT